MSIRIFPQKPKHAIECFHMMSRRPYWCPKTMKRRPCWCPKPFLRELNSFLMQTLSFVPINLHRRWPREWKHSIGKKRYRVPRGEGLGVAWHNSSSVWIAFACSLSCPMTGRIRNQTLVHFVSDNRLAFHIASQYFDLCFNSSLQCIRTALISMVS